MVAKIHIELLVSTTEERNMYTLGNVISHLFQLFLYNLNFLRKKGEREERKVEKDRTEDWDPDFTMSEF